MIASSLQTITLMVLMLASALNAPSCATARPPAEARGGKEKATAVSRSQPAVRRAEAAANRFIKRFRETLDFGLVFDEMFVSDAVQRLRNAGFFRGINISERLVQNLDEAALERTYKAFMNYYYLKAAYDLGVGKEEGAPPEVAAALRASKFHNLLSDEGSGDSPTITTRHELEEYVADLNNIAALYRQQLPQNVFDSATYKTSLKAINKDKHSQVRVRNGYEDFGIKEGTKVYTLEQDIFIFFLVEENGELKVLTLGMGN
jgi:hypothetical protein